MIYQFTSKNTKIKSKYIIDINKLEELICGGGNIMLVELCFNFYLVSKC